MSTTIAKHCLFVRAQPAELWSQASNPRTWPNWNPALKSVEFKGSAVLGARGHFFLDSGPASPFEVTAVQPDKAIALESQLLWLRVTQEVRIVEITEGSVLIVEVSCSGTSAAIVARVLRKLLLHNVERTAVRLKNCVERTKSADTISTKNPSAATTA